MRPNKIRITSTSSVGIGVTGTTTGTRYFDNNSTTTFAADPDLVRIMQIRQFYSNQDTKYIDSIVLAVCSQLKGESVIFSSPATGYGMPKHGKIVSVKGNKVHLWEGYHKRRLDIKNMLIYHPSVYAALLCSTT